MSVQPWAKQYISLSKSRLPCTNLFGKEFRALTVLIKLHLDLTYCLYNDFEFFLAIKTSGARIAEKASLKRFATP